MHAFQCWGEMPYNCKVALLGRGNVSRGALKLLSMLGAEIIVYDRKTEKLFRKEVGKFDVIVNAIGEMIFTVIEALPDLITALLAAFGKFLSSIGTYIKNNDMRTAPYSKFFWSTNVIKYTSNKNSVMPTTEVAFNSSTSSFTGGVYDANRKVCNPSYPGYCLFTPSI